jgi:hypothetical protein
MRSVAMPARVPSSERAIERRRWAALPGDRERPDLGVNALGAATLVSAAVQVYSRVS